ncbi:YopX family protein [uncultured Flavobacterium sp.]|uniref:YopX family protein n=1 Tax=uncultured Flavobacterium sp. TaxID=165435 RepID=UPI0030EEA18E|tara:strand:+ start:988 stop:1365 length:378 start_codon:yes stop_codon:yes gene_type:complete
MNREIIFRGKDKEGKWHYGNLMQKLDPTKKENLIVSCFIQDMALSSTEVSPTTVGQYIGVDDKDEDRIFEGDIIKKEETDSPEMVGIVSYLEREFTTLDNYFDMDDECILNYKTEIISIIGNIHD